jgi:hypothetical protein
LTKGDRNQLSAQQLDGPERKQTRLHRPAQRLTDADLRALPRVTGLARRIDPKDDFGRPVLDASHGGRVALAGDCSEVRSTHPRRYDLDLEPQDLKLVAHANNGRVLGRRADKDHARAVGQPKRARDERRHGGQQSD